MKQYQDITYKYVYVFAISEPVCFQLNALNGFLGTVLKFSFFNMKQPAKILANTWLLGGLFVKFI